MSASTQSSLFHFDRAQLASVATARHAEFATASPFPHVVIDDLLPAQVLLDVLAEYPEPEAAPWEGFRNDSEVKLALRDTEQMGPATRNLFGAFNGQVFTDFLETLTGIEHLVPDPHLLGGGLHQIRAGGYLKVHADFNHHPRLKLDRRLNVLVYLNQDWEPGYGGNLELWEKDMSAVGHSVAPAFNRMVVFATTDDAFHGHPEPLTCPPDRARRSLALYYYSNGRPDHERAASHSTLFKGRPGEHLKTPLRDRLRQWVPPALVELAQRRRR